MSENQSTGHLPIADRTWSIDQTALWLVMSEVCINPRTDDPPRCDPSAMIVVGDYSVESCVSRSAEA